MILTCKKCGVEKEDKFFSAHSQCKTGYDISACKPCKKAAFDWKKTPLEKRMYNRTKARAKQRNIEFSLELSDIVLPKFCPVFKRKLIYADPDWTYSIDRINPNLGYIKGNIVIMSNRANMLKNDATASELQLVVDYLRACEVV